MSADHAEEKKGVRPNVASVPRRYQSVSTLAFDELLRTRRMTNWGPVYGQNIREADAGTAQLRRQLNPERYPEAILAKTHDFLTPKDRIKVKPTTTRQGALKDILYRLGSNPFKTFGYREQLVAPELELQPYRCAYWNLTSTNLLDATFCAEQPELYSAICTMKDGDLLALMLSLSCGMVDYYAYLLGLTTIDHPISNNHIRTTLNLMTWPELPDDIGPFFHLKEPLPTDYDEDMGNPGFNQLGYILDGFLPPIIVSKYFGSPEYLEV